MKKWLNIKPEFYDFSEDEVDTETESEDDGIILLVLRHLLKLKLHHFLDIFIIKFLFLF